METFFPKVIIMMTVAGVALYFINKALRKWLKVEKKQIFSYNHVNEVHKKWDWGIRISFIVLLIISFVVNIYRGFHDPIWYLQTHILLFVFIIASEAVRVIMEKKYAANKNDYIFTSIQLALILLFLTSMFSTNFFGLFTA
ncbi:DUF4181 domain-containing protein [Guptibacillus hwajinpoensis]|uniref:DUF4181 domain-containing protein n=1 Tax=Guptibacillus hwajinpoensis TaxID=208199 RepID=UPI001CFDDA13|nr:DUF4181 domain-containing protein [Pseudalkalibacillus hwajinpoensis]WLR58989.1 DUF4181 domain-containing protein [Pseudalkalibacillus hwajinpoensis]